MLNKGIFADVKLQLWESAIIFNQRKNITVNANDYKLGLYITSVGHQVISEVESYPPDNHPVRYIFNTTGGRVLNEFQLLYITKGKGMFSSRTAGKREVNEG